MTMIVSAMTLTKHLFVLFLLNFFQNNVSGRVLNKREIQQNIKNVLNYNNPFYKKSLLGDFEEKILEEEILQELNHLSLRKQREIFVNLEKQQEKFNTTQKSLISSESEVLSPLNVEELKNIRKTIKASNSSLPAIRNKRTLNLLLSLVARAMGYSLTPNNPDAEWIPRQQPMPSPQPCVNPPPPCRPSPPSTPPPCAMPPTTPPCPGSGVLMQPATIPPNQINANTISYPFRPARTIPLFNFAPLPAGIRVPYPPLLQPPAQQRSPCVPQQPSPPPCSTPAPTPCSTPAPPPPPCNTPAPPAPPCSTPAPPAPPCSTPAPPPPPCNTPAPPPPPCSTPAPPPPPCGTTPAPPPPPCMTPTPQPPPCNSTPAPKPQPCATTPAPPIPPCASPAPPCANPTQSSSPCTPPRNPPPCGSLPPASPPPSKPLKKSSVVLEYDDPVRIEIFSNDKKYLPASGSVYSGDYDEQQRDWHSHFFPTNEKNKNNDFEEEEMQDEYVEEEEEDEAPGHLKHYEEEDEKVLANSEDEEDESETNLSIVKKPIDQDKRKTRQKTISSRRVTALGDKENEKDGNNKHDNKEKTQKMKKPKRKKWVRIVKKQRRKTKTNSKPQDNLQVYTSDSVPDGSRLLPNIYGEAMSKRAYHSYDVSDFSNDSTESQSTEDLGDFRKVTISKKQIHAPELEKAYEFNINPYTHVLEPEEARRAKLEKAVEKYVEDYVEKQLGQELVKNTGIPKTTVFEFAPQNGPKIQTITTTVAKTSHSGPSNAKTSNRPSNSARPSYRRPNENTQVVKKSNYEQSLKKKGNTYEALIRKF